MRKLLLAATTLLVVNFATLQPASADFGSLLEKLPFWSDSPASASEPTASPGKANATLVAQPPLPSAAATPRPLDAPAAATQATEESMPDPEAMLESLGQPRLNRVEPAERPLAGPASSAAGSSRSPVPPPHIPDASAGMKSESSVRRLGPSEEATDGMIEADAERAGAEVALPSPVLQEPGSAVGSGNAYATTAPAGEACRCRSGQREHAHVPSRCAARPGHQLVPNRPAPAPYVYSGPGLPPPASFESFRRTPECYRGVWDGYATEKARRCRFCHDHLHDRCSCHQEACSTADPWVGQPAGHCARAASASPRGY